MGALGLACKHCHHSYKDHKHMAYTKKVVAKQFFNPEAESKINEKGSLKEKKEEMLRQLIQKKGEYEYEQDILMRSAAEFATFMKNTALIPYNDSFVEYLDMMIKHEHNTLSWYLAWPLTLGFVYVKTLNKSVTKTYRYGQSFHQVMLKVGIRSIIKIKNYF